VGCGPFIDKIESVIVITHNDYGTPVYTILAHAVIQRIDGRPEAHSYKLAFQYVYMLSMKSEYF
jgi:hypothetical protein